MVYPNSPRSGYSAIGFVSLGHMGMIQTHQPKPVWVAFSPLPAEPTTDHNRASSPCFPEPSKQPWASLCGQHLLLLDSVSIETLWQPLLCQHFSPCEQLWRDGSALLTVVRGVFFFLRDLHPIKAWSLHIPQKRLSRTSQGKKKQFDSSSMREHLGKGQHTPKGYKAALFMSFQPGSNVNQNIKIKVFKT